MKSHFLVILFMLSFSTLFALPKTASGNSILAKTNVARNGMAKIGTLISVDPSTMTITIQTPKGQETITYFDSTRMVTLKKTSSASDLCPGNRIIVLYVLENKQMVISKIIEKFPVASINKVDSTKI